MSAEAKAASAYDRYLLDGLVRTVKLLAEPRLRPLDPTGGRAAQLELEALLDRRPEEQEARI